MQSKAAVITSDVPLVALSQLSLESKSEIHSAVKAAYVRKGGDCKFLGTWHIFHSIKRAPWVLLVGGGGGGGGWGASRLVEGTNQHVSAHPSLRSLNHCGGRRCLDAPCVSLKSC